MIRTTWVALILTLVLPALLSGCGGEQERSVKAPDTAGNVGRAGCALPALGVREIKPRASRRALRGQFRVYGFRARLEPPVDWAMDPHGSLRFQAYLSNWDFMEPLIAGYVRTGRAAYLRAATALAADWARANPRGTPAGGPGTWSGKITGDRAPRLAYLIAAAGCAGAVPAAQGRELRRSLRDHIRILLGPESAGDTNHALYVQIGLAAVAKQLPQLAGAERIRSLAQARFRRVLEGRLADGMWLEHSTSYQFLAIRVVERMVGLLAGDAALEGRLREMKEAAAWLVAPDGRHTLLGDSRMLKAPEDIAARAGALEGLGVFPAAGLAAVRSGGSHLVVTAGFHNTTHKHADELSFELSEGGRRIVADTGMYHKDPGAVRDFVVAARAHSTLTADGGDFPVGDESRAYGSGILASGAGSGWYGVLARNPLLEGIAHRRLYLYRPAEGLIIVDRARGTRRHEYTRRLQLAPGIDVEPAANGTYALTGAGIDATLYDSPGAAPVTANRVEGRRRPLAGFMATDYRQWEPRTTLELTSTERRLDRVLTLGLDGSALRAEPGEAGGRDLVLRLAGGDGELGAIRVARQGTTLTIAPESP